MAVLLCSHGGLPGYQWGNDGAVFLGDDGEVKAKALGAYLHACQIDAELLLSKGDISAQDLADNGGLLVDEIAKKYKKKKPGSLMKTDEELRIVWAEVYIPDIPDSQGDFMSATEIRKTAHSFISKGIPQNIDLEHDEHPHGCAVVESFIVRKDDPDFIEGAWVVGVHVPDDDLWEQVTKGEINGFSMSGTGHREEATIKMEIPENLTGATDAVNGHTHTFTVHLDKSGMLESGETSEVDGHSHKIVKGTVTEDADGHNHRFSFVDELVEIQNG